jgi:hypothetical protein
MLDTTTNTELVATSSLSKVLRLILVQQEVGFLKKECTGTLHVLGISN